MSPKVRRNSICSLSPRHVAVPTDARDRDRSAWRKVAVLILLAIAGACHTRQTAIGPTITFTRIPPSVLADPDKIEVVQGRVEGAHAGQRIVLYAKTGSWWVQPLANEPFTPISPDSSWINFTHMGSEYAALLVEPGYRPQTQVNTLPTPGNGVTAVATTKDVTGSIPLAPSLQFSGYEWRIRNAPSNRGDHVNSYSAANAWTDAGGALHLRIAKESGKWTCAEVTLTRSFGYGLYSFVVRDTSNLGPGVIFSTFTWDYAGGDQNHREMAFEIGRLQEPTDKNAQYVIQPFYVAANVARFTAPTGIVTHSFRWEPGKVSFKTVRGSAINSSAVVLGEHVFTSGVPSPGVESVRLALYIFGQTESPGLNGAEVVIEKFQYLP